MKVLITGRRGGACAALWVLLLASLVPGAVAQYECWTQSCGKGCTETVCSASPTATPTISSAGTPPRSSVLILHDGRAGTIARGAHRRDRPPPPACKHRAVGGGTDAISITPRDDEAVLHEP